MGCFQRTQANEKNPVPLHMVHQSYRGILGSLVLDRIFLFLDRHSTDSTVISVEPSGKWRKVLGVKS